MGFGHWKGLTLAVLAMGVGGAGAPVPNLTAYVDKYPSNKVGGTSLYDHPTYQRLVNVASPSSGVRHVVQTGDVESPVERQGQLLVARGCEAHTCDDHQWLVAIRLPNGPAAICYHDSALMDEEARWFIAGRAVGVTKGCWNGDYTAVPQGIYERLSKVEE